MTFGLRVAVTDMDAVARRGVQKGRAIWVRADVSGFGLAQSCGDKAREARREIAAAPDHSAEADLAVGEAGEHGREAQEVGKRLDDLRHAPAAYGVVDGGEKTKGPDRRNRVACGALDLVDGAAGESTLGGREHDEPLPKGSVAAVDHAHRSSLRGDALGGGGGGVVGAADLRGERD